MYIACPVVDSLAMTSGHSVAVVGPGAIGATIAACLQRGGHTPILCGRTPLAQLRVESEHGAVTVTGPVRTDPGELDGPLDAVFLAVKAVQIEAASAWLARLCSPATELCVLQNGVEQRELVAPYAGGARVTPSVVWFPAEVVGRGEVRLRGEPAITVPDDDGGRAVAERLRDSGCGVELADDFTSAAWRKLCLNAVAALMVLTRRRAGVFRDEALGELARRYLRECVAVARAEGARLDHDDADAILAQFRSMAPDLGTSMLVDAEAGRPLEWDARNGVVQRRARAHGIATPISDVLVPLLSAASA
jgi:2-dehydropantoate 2-reductase